MNQKAATFTKKMIVKTIDHTCHKPLVANRKIKQQKNVENMAFTVEDVAINSLLTRSKSVHFPATINTRDSVDLLLIFHHVTTQHTSN